MPIRTLRNNLPASPDNYGSVFGWGVVQISPLRFVNIYATKEAAEAEVLARDSLSVEYGSHRLGTDDFVWGGRPQQ